MKNLKEVILALFVSPEACIILAFSLGAFVYTKPLEFLATKIKDSAEIVKYLALLPVGSMIKVFVDARELLLPQYDDKQRLLQRWPSYWKLKLRFYVAFFYSILFSILGITSWISKWSHLEVLPLALLLCSVIGGAVVYFTIYIARIKEHEIFAEFGRDS